MYVPEHFAMTPAQLQDALRTVATGDLVTATAAGPVATLLPFVHEPADDGYGTLLTHVTRTNPQWHEPHLGEALVILHVNEHYVSPTWRPSSVDPNAAVPTLNYVTVHAYGVLTVHEEPEWLAEAVRKVTDRHEVERPSPWRVEDMDPDRVARMLRAAVGLELRITRVEGKAKLSQNVSPTDVAGIIDGLREAGDEESADWLSQVSLPHAVARAELLAHVGALHARRTGSSSAAGRRTQPPQPATSDA